MDRCSNSGEKSQRRERVREEEKKMRERQKRTSQRRERKKKSIQSDEKVDKSRNAVLFQAIAAPEGPKV